MKRIFTILAISLSSLSFGQIGAVGTDFTVTDTDGQSHNLYTLLGQGYVVLLDVSATWCGPCFDFHNEHFLEELNAQYGPTGTNKIRVVFYEGDAETGADALAGTGGNTLGNWTTGVTYPIINEAPLTVNLDNYAPNGFPTVNVICPSDKKIKADLFDNFSGTHATDIAAMKTVIDNAITTCAISGGGSAGIKEIALMDSRIYPNPSTGLLNLSFSSLVNEVVQVKVSNLVGQVMYSNTLNVENGNNIKEFDFSNLKAGSYLLTVINSEGITSTQSFQLK